MTLFELFKRWVSCRLMMTVHKCLLSFYTYRVYLLMINYIDCLMNELLHALCMLLLYLFRWSYCMLPLRWQSFWICYIMIQPFSRRCSWINVLIRKEACGNQFNFSCRPMMTVKVLILKQMYYLNANYHQQFNTKWQNTCIIGLNVMTDFVMASLSFIEFLWSVYVRAM